MTTSRRPATAGRKSAPGRLELRTYCEVDVYRQDVSPLVAAVREVRGQWMSGMPVEPPAFD